jgi:hypothetical protein
MDLVSYTQLQIYNKKIHAAPDLWQIWIIARQTQLADVSAIACWIRKPCTSESLVHQKALYIRNPCTSVLYINEAHQPCTSMRPQRHCRHNTAQPPALLPHCFSHFTSIQSTHTQPSLLSDVTCSLHLHILLWPQAVRVTAYTFLPFALARYWRGGGGGGRGGGGGLCAWRACRDVIGRDKLRESILMHLDPP